MEKTATDVMLLIKDNHFFFFKTTQRQIVRGKNKQYEMQNSECPIFVSEYTSRDNEVTASSVPSRRNNNNN